MRQPLGNDLDFGEIPGGNGRLGLPNKARDKHLYICGGTGVGKSKFLEYLIRQDIKAWRKGRVGMLVIDPHGSLYDNLIKWMAWHNIDRPVIPIDFRQDDWVVSYNLLRQRTADPAVLVDNITDAMAYVWGADGTDQTPLFARWAGNVIRALYEKRHTLVEAGFLIDHLAKRIRYAMTADLKDRPSRQDWMFANSLSAKDFEGQIGSTVNRLQRFIRNEAMRSTFGQPNVSFDLGKAWEEGAIILVSLATEGARISEENARVFGTLLLSDLWTAAKERGKREPIKPFNVYIDEFQEFITPTIAKNLDQARGFGLRLTMAHQFPNQLITQGENGRRIYESIMENASSKVVFRLSHEDNLRVMAQWLFRGVMNPDEIKHQLYSTKVMEYREEYREVYAESRSSGTARGSQRGHASGYGSGGTENFLGDEIDEDPLSTSLSWSDFASDSASENHSASESTSESRSLVPMLIPVFGKELSHVQFRSLEEQLFRAMAVLFDQKERQAVARFVGMSAPVSIYTPTIVKVPSSDEGTKRYLEGCYEKLGFALPSAVAKKQLTDRAETFALDVIKEMIQEPVSAKRRIR